MKFWIKLCKRGLGGLTVKIFQPSLKLSFFFQIAEQFQFQNSFITTSHLCTKHNSLKKQNKHEFDELTQLHNTANDLLSHIPTDTFTSI